MQVPSFGKELTSHSIGRDDNLSLLIMLQEVPQPSSMVAMPVGNKNIVNIAEVYIKLLCVSDKHITRSSIKQDLVPLRC
jgi:hypothetical protein